MQFRLPLPTVDGIQSPGAIFLRRIGFVRQRLVDQTKDWLFFFCKPDVNGKLITMADELFCSIDGIDVPRSSTSNIIQFFANNSVFWKRFLKPIDNNPISCNVCVSYRCTV